MDNFKEIKIDLETYNKLIDKLNEINKGLADSEEGMSKLSLDQLIYWFVEDELNDYFI